MRNCCFELVRQFLSCGGSYPPASVARNVLSNKLYRPRIVTLQFIMLSSSVHFTNIVTLILRNSFFIYLVMTNNSESQGKV